MVPGFEARDDGTAAASIFGGCFAGPAQIYI